MKSIEDLKRARDEAHEAIKLRTPAGMARVMVRMGTCGIAAGARETMLTLIDELRKRNLLDVAVTEAGCIGLCSREPIVEVQLPGEKNIVYGNVDPTRARQIVATHVANKMPIEEWVLNVQKTH